MFSIGDSVKLKEPFGDEATVLEISEVMGIDEDGAPSLTSGKEAVYYQYLLGDSFYAEQFLTKV